MVYSLSGGTTVYIVTQDTQTWYFSPGCSVTETFSVDVSEQGTGEDAEAILFKQPAGQSHIVRIDAQISLDDSINDGLTEWPAFNKYQFIRALRKCGQTQSQTLHWGDISYEGLVKSVTFTQRSGEGNLYDAAVTFVVGDVTGGSVENE